MLVTRQAGFPIRDIQLDRQIADHSALKRVLRKTGDDVRMETVVLTWLRFSSPLTLTAISALSTRLGHTDQPPSIVLLGDYDLMHPLDKELEPALEAGVEVWWIHGNHDADREDWHDNLFSSGLKDCKVAAVAGLPIAPPKAQAPAGARK